MKIGIIGAGNIGTILARRLARAGHHVSIANSRAPQTVPEAALSTGATAVWAAEVTKDADVVITSVNMGQIPDVAPLVAQAPPTAVIIDTSNYFPHRDGVIDALEGTGLVESLWVQQQYGRPITKAWNTITTASFAEKTSQPGAPERVALPVAGDDEKARVTAMALVETTGFEAFDAGAISESWRQQPGTPVYTNDLTASQLPEALSRADASRSARRRDLMWAVLTERVEAEGSLPSSERQLALTRAIF